MNMVIQELDSRENTAHATETRIVRTRTILFVTNAYSYGGSEKHLLELLSRIHDGTVQAIILCTDSDPFSARLKNRSDAAVTVRSERGLKSILDWVRVLRDIKPDIVVLVYGTLWLLPWGAALAARIAGSRRVYAIQHLMPQSPPDPLIKTIRSPRDVLRFVFGKRVRRILGAKIVGRLCKETICVSNAVRDSLVRQYAFPPRKTRTIHNGISTRDFDREGFDRMSIRSRLHLADDEFLIVCTARLSVEKGLEILLGAMSRIVQEYPMCKCIVIGEGPLRESLAVQVESLKLADHVFFQGFQTDVRPFLAAADAFLLTSYIEGLPYSILEAMACGLPCVVTNVGGNAEAVIQNKTGIIVQPGAIDQVVEAMSYLISHPQERVEMGKAGALRAKDEFDIEEKMAEIRDVILS